MKGRPILWTPDGYLVEATGEVIPEKQTLRSPDGDFHRCIYLGGPQKNRTRWFAPGKTRCLWVPEAGA